jgi:hypothetical protein
MRNKILLAAAAAVALSSVAAIPFAASAGPTPAQMKKDGEIKNPVKADEAIAKDEAKDAKKKAHVAHKKAKVARHKAKVAAKKAEKVEKSEGAPPQ